jgi:hypothetical protein
MPRDIPAIRILPMSDKITGFRGRSIDQVQAECFQKGLPAQKGRYRYQTTGLNADPGTVVLFQFKARIIASGIFLRDERFSKSRHGYGGVLHFDPESFRIFDPLDVAAMRKVWSSFRAFGHVKQYLNPTLYSQFKRRLKNVKLPTGK